MARIRFFGGVLVVAGSAWLLWLYYQATLRVVEPREWIAPGIVTAVGAGCYYLRPIFAAWRERR